MNINSKIGSIVGLDGIVAPKAVDKTAKVRVTAPISSSDSSSSSDTVQISDAGRARAARENASSGLDPQRAAQIRQRVLDAAYNSLDVVNKVAQRVLDSGDL